MENVSSCMCQSTHYSLTQECAIEQFHSWCSTVTTLHYTTNKTYFWLLLQIMWDINTLFQTIWQTAFVLSSTDLSFDAITTTVVIKWLNFKEKYPPQGWEFPSIQPIPGAAACCGSGKCVQAYPAYSSANPSFSQVRMSFFDCVKQVCPQRCILKWRPGLCSYSHAGPGPALHAPACPLTYFLISHTLTYTPH